MVKDKKTILVIRNDRFGEFLLNIPAIRALKETFKESRIILAADPYVEGLAKRISCIDEVIIWKKDKHSFAEIFRFSGMLKKKNIDMALIMNPSKDSNIAVFLAGIPQRLGYDHKWDFLLTKKLKDLKGLGQKHEVEYNMDMARLAGADTKEMSLSIDVTQFQSGNVNIPGLESHDAIAIHPWTSDPVKQWPEDRFKELALRLAKEADTDIVIIGGKDEWGRSVIYNKLSNRIRNLTGKTSLVELASILKRCRLLISGDSGPVHLACAVGTPVIALFRNDIPHKGPTRWGPWGRNNIVIEKKNLSDISVEEVFFKIKESLGNRIQPTRLPSATS